MPQIYRENEELQVWQGHGGQVVCVLQGGVRAGPQTRRGGGCREEGCQRMRRHVGCTLGSSCGSGKTRTIHL